MRNQPAALASLYFEDSYFLGLLVGGATVRIRGLFALAPDHEAYLPPAFDEQHCYCEGEITLTGVQVTKWVPGKPMLLNDPDGSMDLGGLEFCERGGGYEISTEWFEMSCRAKALSVTLDAPAHHTSP